MKKLYHEPAKVIPEVNIELTSCNRMCPHYKTHDGEGHCDDWTTCSKLGVEIWSWRGDEHKIVDGFPASCPLKEINDGDKLSETEHHP